MSDGERQNLALLVGKLDGKLDGIVEKVDEVHRYAFRIDSKLNGEILARNRIADEVTNAKSTFQQTLAAHAASDEALRADVKKIKRWVIIAGVAGAIVVAVYAPEHVPKIIQAIVGIL